MVQAVSFDPVMHDLKRHLRQIDEEEMFENELELKVYDRDTGYGRIVIHTIDGATYLGDDIKGTLELVEDFITEKLGRA